MKVAILSPISWRTPPLKYGPWEQVASNIAEGLVSKGIDVTLFATSNSKTSGKLEWICEKPYSEDSSVDPKVWECLHISHIMEMAGEFDIIHNHYDFLPLTYSKLIKTPIITTIHGFSSPQIVPVYKKYNKHVHYVSISNSDRNPELDYLATVYNGINTKDFTFNPSPKDYLLYFGRIHQDKGTFEAIEIAKKASKKLIISGLIQDQTYFNEFVKPHIDEKQIFYVGNSGPKERDRLLGEALALLHPINFEEPFGLSVAEAMMCGTPVIAFNKGSMPELIENNKTGFLVNTISEANISVQNIELIDRKYCSEYARKKFSLEKMVDAYFGLYTKILNKTKA